MKTDSKQMNEPTYASICVLDLPALPHSKTLKNMNEGSAIGPVEQMFAVIIQSAFCFSKTNNICVFHVVNPSQ